MKDVLREYRIDFSGLAPGTYTYRYRIGQELFDHFGYSDGWTDALADVTATLTKRQNVMELSLSCQGTVLTPCDMTGVEFRLSVEGSEELVVKQGDEFREDDDIITLPREEPSINIARYVYELFVLNVPQKRYHPDYLSGKLQAPALRSSADENPGGDGQDPIDPRWAKLKDIKS